MATPINPKQQMIRTRELLQNKLEWLRERIDTTLFALKEDAEFPLQQDLDIIGVFQGYVTKIEKLSQELFEQKKQFKKKI